MDGEFDRPVEKGDSIEVSRTSTGKYSASVKIRSKDLTDRNELDKVIKAVSDAYMELKTKFDL